MTLLRYTLLFILCSSVRFMAFTQVPDADKGTTFVPVPTKSEYSKVYAVVVGITNYQSKPLNTLHYAASDARSMAKFIRSLPVENHVIELVDQKASKPEIDVRGLDWITGLVRNQTIKNNDLIILYFSGHGGAYSNSDDAKAFFFTYESESFTDAGTSANITVIKNNINNWVEESRAKVIFIFDACRSVTGMPDVGSKKKIKEALERDVGEIIFAATNAHESAWEQHNIKHGVLTYYLLKGLHGYADTNNRGMVNVFDLESYVKRTVDSCTNRTQQPYVNARDFTRFVVVPYRMGGTRFHANVLDSLIVPSPLETSITNQLKLTQLKESFKKCIVAGNLVRPMKANAVSYYLEMQRIAPDDSIVDQRADLLISLYKAAQTVIKNDLNGYRYYLRPGPQEDSIHTRSRVLGMNLDYYRSAADCLEKYIDIMGKRKVDGVTFAMNRYLEGRQLSLEYSESHDASLLEKSRRILTDATKDYPEHAFLWQALGGVFIQQELFTEAKPRIRKARTLAPRWSSPLISLGTIAKKEGNVELARQYYDSAIRLNPGDISTYVSLSTIETGKKSLYYLRKAFQLDPGVPSVSILLGLEHFMLSDNDSCLYFLKAAMKTDSTLEVPYEFSAHALMAKAEYDEALTLIKRATKRFPASAQIYNILGLVYSGMDKATESEQSFHTSLKLDPKAAETWYNLGGLYLKHERYTEAVAAYTKAIELNPNYYEPHNDIGICHEKQEKFQKAAEAYRKAITIDPQRDEAHFNLGREYERQKKFKEAIDEYKTALQLDSTNLGASYKLGKAYYNDKQLSSAIVVFSLIVKNNPKDVYPHNQLALYYLEAGRHDLAVGVQMKAIALDSSVANYEMLANIYLDEKKYNEVIQVCKESIARQPSSSMYFLLGEAYEKNNLLREAISAFDSAAVLDSTFLDAYRKSIILHHTLREYDAEITGLQKILPLDKPNASIYRMLIGDAFKLLGNLEQARINYQEAIAINEKNVGAYVGLADVFNREMKFPEAIGAFQKALEHDQDPSNAPDYLNDIAIAYHLNHQEKEALETLKKAYRIDPKHQLVPYNMACVLALQNKTTDAIGWLEIAFQNGFNDWETLMSDPDLKSIVNEEAFKMRLAKYRK